MSEKAPTASLLNANRSEALCSARQITSKNTGMGISPVDLLNNW